MWLIISALLVATLMGLGVGGGGLFVLYLIFFEGYMQITAQGTNLVFFLLASLASLVFHTKKRKIRWQQVFYMIFFGSIGSATFSLLLDSVNPHVPRIILGGVLIIGGAITLSRALLSFKKTRKSA